MIILAIVVLLFVVTFLVVKWPKVPKAFPPGGSRRPLPLIGDALSLGSDLFKGIANLHKVSLNILKKNL
jgi:hypothetical protein